MNGPGARGRNPEAGTPIECHLSSAELGERLAWIRERLAAHATTVEARDAVVRVRAPLGAEALGFATELIRGEAECCPFLTLRLEVDGPGGALTLEASGPPRAAEVLRQWVKGAGTRGPREPGSPA